MIWLYSFQVYFFSLHLFINLRHGTLSDVRQLPRYRYCIDVSDFVFYVVSIVINSCVSDFAAIAASSAWFMAARRESMSGVTTKRLLISPSTRRSLLE